MSAEWHKHCLMLRFHLIQSALDQKAETKLDGLAVGESSQVDPAMGRREEASLPVLAGWRLGRVNGRASSLRAKSASLPLVEIPEAANAVSGHRIDLVYRVVMSGRWCSYPTDEVPRCPRSLTKVIPGYKLDVKDRGYAPVSRALSQGSTLWGWQQGRNSSATPSQRPNRSQSVSPGPCPGTVSRASVATKWPAGTSFRQHVLSTKKHPTCKAQDETDQIKTLRETL